MSAKIHDDSEALERLLHIFHLSSLGLEWSKHEGITVGDVDPELERYLIPMVSIDRITDR